jgi:hypothetical protein
LHVAAAGMGGAGHMTSLLAAAACAAPDSEPSLLSYICDSQRVGELRVLALGVSFGVCPAVPSPELGRARGETVADDTCDADSLTGPFGATPDAFSPFGGVRADSACTWSSCPCRSDRQPEAAESRSRGDVAALSAHARSLIGTAMLLATTAPPLMTPPLRPTLTAAPARALLGDKHPASSLRMLDAGELTGEGHPVSARVCAEAAVSPVLLRDVFARLLAACSFCALSMSASSSRVLSSRNILSCRCACSRLAALVFAPRRECSSPAPSPGGATPCSSTPSTSSPTLRRNIPTPWPAPSPSTRRAATLENATAPTRFKGASLCTRFAHAVNGAELASPDMHALRRPVTGRPAERKRSSSLS